MNKLILSFALGIIATFFLVGGIDYIVHPDYPPEWKEEITYPTAFFNDPWMPLAFIIIGATGGAVMTDTILLSLLVVGVGIILIVVWKGGSINYCGLSPFECKKISCFFEQIVLPIIGLGFIIIGLFCLVGEIVSIYVSHTAVLSIPESWHYCTPEGCF